MIVVTDADKGIEQLLWKQINCHQDCSVFIN